ncbi:hypothetical protein GMDG_01906 [Pseudogymnoascus destructans 20631-21]|uniref:Uncharacterized protein n=1 Tax=Pseudogymnoascus destructans (strain ATCC MYA-4855 / 20631-21) TaxID=658429 RepID=L8FZI9_PSED2|nr:hypothetical protein GMDG_01906 [Pseudogymnoascus destructans 20631-21]
MDVDECGITEPRPRKIGGRWMGVMHTRTWGGKQRYLTHVRWPGDGRSLIPSPSIRQAAPTHRRIDGCATHRRTASSKSLLTLPPTLGGRQTPTRKNKQKERETDQDTGTTTQPRSYQWETGSFCKGYIWELKFINQLATRLFYCFLCCLS